MQENPPPSGTAGPAPDAAAPAPEDPKVFLYRAARFLALGAEQRSTEAYAQARAIAPKDDAGNPVFTGEAAEIDAMLANWRPPALLRRPIMRPNPPSDVMESPKGDAPVLVVVFLVTGTWLLVPLELIDAELAGRGVTTLYLNDRRRMGFALGVHSLGEGHERMMAYIRERAEALGAERLVTLGISITGCVTLAAALHLRASSCLLFSPVVASSAAFRARYRDGRRQDLTAEVESRVGRMMDAQYWYETTSHRPAVDIYFGTGHRNDIQQAESLRDYEGVSLHPIEGFTPHNPLWDAYAKGWIGPALDRALGLNPPATRTDPPA